LNNLFNTMPLFCSGKKKPTKTKNNWIDL